MTGFYGEALSGKYAVAAGWLAEGADVHDISTSTWLTGDAALIAPTTAAIAVSEASLVDDW